MGAPGVSRRAFRPALVRSRTSDALMESTRSRARTFESFGDRKSTRLNSSHSQISYAVFCLTKKNSQTDMHFALRHVYHKPAQQRILFTMRCAHPANGSVRFDSFRYSKGVSNLNQAPALRMT